MKVGRSELKRRASDILRKGLTDALLHLIIDSLWRDADEIVRIVNVSINNSFVSNSNITNNSTTNIYNTIRSIVNQQSENNHESILIEDTVANTVTQESSWSVEPFDQQVGEFKAVVMIHNKATNTIITLMSLLSFDYSDTPPASLQSDLITGTATLTVSVSAGNKLQAVVTGMAGDNKRIHFCFERCVMGMRASDMEANGLFELDGVANLVLAEFVDITASGSLELDGTAIVDELVNVAALGELELNGVAEITDEEPVGGFGLLYNGFITQEQPTEIENGFLYNYHAATDSRNIAPSGWHVPTFSEVQSLVSYLGGQDVAGGKLKQTGTSNWNSPNTGATNETGFNAIGSGLRYDFGSYDELKVGFHIWAIGIPYAGSAYTVGMNYSHDNFGYAATPFKSGRAIRLIKDNDTLDTLTGNDGKVYRTVKIGNQVWMAENLMETKYRNGDDIPESIWDWSTKTEGARCSYNNIESNAGSTKKLSSSDNWVVPSETQSSAMIYFLGGELIAGGKLKETDFIHWNSPNTGATNEVGFNALGAGYRLDDGSYFGFKEYAGFKTITRGQPGFIFQFDFENFSTYATTYEGSINSGSSLRLCNPNTFLSEGQSGTYTQNDGTVLKTIVINGIEWLAENLKETMWRDGTLINLVEDSTEWSELEDPAYCYVNGNPNTM